MTVSPKRFFLSLCALLLLPAAIAHAQEEVPFITTPDHVTLAMLQLAGVTASDHVIDLGSGDGRIVITAAKRFGASGLGVEIVPDLVRKSRENARAAGVSARAEFLEQDLFNTDLRRATVVTMYLLPEVNLQLRPRLLALAPGTRIVSHDWDLGDWAPDRTLTLDVPGKVVGLDKRSRLHLWVVPAPVQGLWCAALGSLQVTQRFQSFSATLMDKRSSTPVMVFDGRIEGRTLRARGERVAVLQAQADVLQLTSVDNVALALAGHSFKRANGASCP